jgi:hypothetical protein
MVVERVKLETHGFLHGVPISIAAHDAFQRIAVWIQGLE